MPAIEADDLMAALEAGAQCEVVDLDGMAPASRGPVFADGWDKGVTAASEALVASRIGTGHGRGGQSAGAAELAVHIAYVRQRERVGLVGLERFARKTVLPRTHPNTTQWRRVPEKLDEAGGLCAARAAEISSGDVIFCTRKTGHYDLDDKPSFTDGKARRLASCGRVDLGRLRLRTSAQGHLRHHQEMGIGRTK
ncbi:hypothetical protein ACIQVR_38660 [Streptomyces xanthochromogenes]|uniref:hypothetical protein n=1 Tax=Streptomyces xanthochromogenes TaxID=67384 RepID=UPI0038171B58